MNADSTILNRWKFFTEMMNRITCLPWEQYNFFHSTFLSISAQFGRIGKGRPGRIWEYEILCLLFSPVNQTAEILPLPSSSYHSKHSVRERERRKKCLELDNQIKYKGLSQKKKKNQVKRLFFCIFYFLKKFYTIIILV